MISKGKSIREKLQISPYTLSISPTHRCTAECTNCCFGCNPRISYTMDIYEIKRIIVEVTDSYPTIKVVVFTGGECFLLGEKLTEIIKFAHKKNLFTRVVTNAYWATTPYQAKQRLKKLVDAGLSEINFSTGIEHQKYVKVDNVTNAVEASVSLGLTNIFVSVESHKNEFDSNFFRNHERTKDFILNRQVICVDSNWISFKSNACNYNFNNLFNQSKRPCMNILTGIYVNPYSQLLSCCGLTSEYNPYLKLGDLRINSVKELYENQFVDLYKIWLHIDGPETIYETIMKARKLNKRIFNHECAYCMEIMRDKENIRIMKELIKDELPNMLFRHKLSSTCFKINKI